MRIDHDNLKWKLCDAYFSIIPFNDNTIHGQKQRCQSVIIRLMDPAKPKAFHGL